MNNAQGTHGHPLILALMDAAASGTPSLAKHPPDARRGTASLTLRVYDYARENRSSLLAAEAEATRILGQAGVNARWTDCPTSRAQSSNYPDCQLPWRVNDYVLDVLPEAMTALLGKSEDALGSTPTCTGSHCTAIVFFDRIERMSNGGTATAPMLLGRAMAHEIGHLLLGAKTHSPSGIMRARWSPGELRLNAGPGMLFTQEQARQMRMRLSEQIQSSQPNAQLGLEAH